MNPSGSLNPSPRTLDVESVASFDVLVAAGADSMHGWHVQSLDLRGRTKPLEVMEAKGSISLSWRAFPLIPTADSFIHRRSYTRASALPPTRNRRMRWCTSGALAQGGAIA